jgi:hypothetical protein
VMVRDLWTTCRVIRSDYDCSRDKLLRLWRACLRSKVEQGVNSSAKPLDFQTSDNPVVVRRHLSTLKLRLPIKVPGIASNRITHHVIRSNHRSWSCIFNTIPVFMRRRESRKLAIKVPPFGACCQAWSLLHKSCMNLT